MPIYEFQCGKCGLKFDHLLKVNDDYRIITCPDCGQISPRKLVSTFRTNSWSAFLDKMEKKVNPHKFK